MTSHPPGAAASADDQPLLALTTLPDEAQARTLARALLEARLVACATVCPGATSLYWWEGRIEEAGECLVVLKTTRRLWPRLSERLAALHPYDVPELVGLAPDELAEPYQRWLLTQASGGQACD